MPMTAQTTMTEAQAMQRIRTLIQVRLISAQANLQDKRHKFSQTEDIEEFMSWNLERMIRLETEVRILTEMLKGVDTEIEGHSDFMGLYNALASHLRISREHLLDYPPNLGSSNALRNLMEVMAHRRKCELFSPSPQHNELGWLEKELCELSDQLGL